MIKITGVERDQGNLDNALVTVSYDIGGVAQPDFVIDADMQMIMGYDLAEIKDYILEKVAEQRGSELWASVENKLNPYVGVDLEA